MIEHQAALRTLILDWRIMSLDYSMLKNLMFVDTRARKNSEKKARVRLMLEKISFDHSLQNS